MTSRKPKVFKMDVVKGEVVSLFGNGRSLDEADQEELKRLEERIREVKKHAKKRGPEEIHP